jgi:hypothetical protein
MERARQRRRVRTRALKLLIAVGVLAVPLVSLVARAEAALLVVRPATGETMAAAIAEKARTVAGVTKVERYLLIRTQPHDVIGVEGDAPLRIVTREGRVIEGKVEVGKPFRKEDEGKNVAIVGKIYAEDYGFRGGAGAMATMKHMFELGQTFKLTEGSPRIRIVGGFSAKPESEAVKVFLPLATAQRLFQHEGKLSHLFISAEGDAEVAAKRVQEALGGEVKASVVSR